MVLERIRLHDFRNIPELNLEPSLGINAFYGKNGHGKTSFLEAIHFLAEGRSHRTVAPSDLVRRGCTQLSVFGDVRSALGTQDHLQASFATSQRTLSLNDRANVPLESYLGHLRVVTHSPEDSELLLGPPEARRRFLNRILVLIQPGFYRTLARYVRSLKNRNRCLKEHASRDEIASWTELLVTAGAGILAARLALVSKLRTEIHTAIARITSSAMPVSLRYRATQDLPSETLSIEQANALLQARSEQCSAQEARLERTLFGPHLDDLQFSVETGAARRHGSQGERRTILIALRLAERAVIASVTDDDPVFLLDDLSNELDDDRARRVLDVVSDLPGQTFVTGTAPPRMPAHAQLYFVESGRIRPEIPTPAAQPSNVPI